MDKIAKFLHKVSKTDRVLLLSILADISLLNLEKYQIKPLKGYNGIYRLRKKDFRIIFYKQSNKGIVIDLDYRKDIYKNI